MDNLYDILGIGKDASQEEIKKAYKKLAIKWHPDKNKDKKESTQKFQKIAYAYSILSDKEKRKQYDKYGTTEQQDESFDEFMNHFNMESFFKFFEEEAESTELEDTSHKHLIKLMLLNKESLFKDDFADFKKKDFNIRNRIFIYGKKENPGFKHFGDEWETEESLNQEKEKENDNKPKGLEEDFLRLFIEENTVETNTKKYICNICKGFKKKLEYLKIKDHFIDKHEAEYNNSKYAKSASFTQAIDFSDYCDKHQEESEDGEGDSLDEHLFNEMFNDGKKGKNKMTDEKLFVELNKMLGFGGIFGGNNASQKKGKKK